MSKKINAKTFPRYTPNPLFAGLSDYVKDPANFNKIQRILLNELAGQHSHSEMTNWANCKTCQDKSQERVMLMRKLGFTSAAIYLGWRKIMEQMISPRRVKIR